jgi:hypothetical protein
MTWPIRITTQVFTLLMQWGALLALPFVIGISVLLVQALLPILDSMENLELLAGAAGSALGVVWAGIVCGAAMASWVAFNSVLASGRSD